MMNKKEIFKRVIKDIYMEYGKNKDYLRMLKRFEKERGMETLYLLLEKRIDKGEWHEFHDSYYSIIYDIFKEKVEKLLSSISDVSVEDLIDDEVPNLEELNEMLERGIYAVHEISDDTESVEKEGDDTKEIPPALKEAIDRASEEIKNFIKNPEAFKALIEEYIRFSFAKNLADLMKNLNYTEEQVFSLARIRREDQPMVRTYMAINIDEFLVKFYEKYKEKIIILPEPTLIKEMLSKSNFFGKSDEFLSSVLSEVSNLISNYNVQINAEVRDKEVNVYQIGIYLPKGEIQRVFTPSIIALRFNPMIPTNEFIKRNSNYVFVNISYASIAKFWWILTRYDPYRNLYVGFKKEMADKLGNIPFSDYAHGVFPQQNWAIFFEGGRPPLNFILFMTHSVSSENIDGIFKELREFFEMEETEKERGIGMIKREVIDQMYDRTGLFNPFGDAYYFNVFHGKVMEVQKDEFIRSLESISYLSEVGKLYEEAVKNGRIGIALAGIIYKLARMILPPYNIYHTIFERAKNIPRIKGIDEVLKRVDELIERIQRGELTFKSRDLNFNIEGLLKHPEVLNIVKKVIEETLPKIEGDIKHSEEDEMFRIKRAFIYIISEVGYPIYGLERPEVLRNLLHNIREFYLDKRLPKGKEPSKEDKEKLLEIEFVKTLLPSTFFTKDTKIRIRGAYSPRKYVLITREDVEVREIKPPEETPEVSWIETKGRSIPYFPEDLDFLEVTHSISPPERIHEPEEEELTLTEEGEKEFIRELLEEYPMARKFFKKLKESGKDLDEEIAKLIKEISGDLEIDIP